MRGLIMSAIATVGLVAPASAEDHGAIEQRVTYYEDGDPSTFYPVGYSLYYCDGYVETHGRVTGNDSTQYYGCS